jgi:thiamine pyrophosphokinase
MRGVIGLGGNCTDTILLREYLKQESFFVAADRGIVHFQMLGIIPDMLVGDMDSIPEKVRVEYEELGLKIERYDTRKDRTDSEIACGYALEEGCNELLMIGALGERPDHVLSNQLMAASLAERGIPVILTDGISFLYTLTSAQSPFVYPTKYIDPDNDVLSLISLKYDFSEIALEGFEYDLIDHKLPFGSCKGVSNTVKIHHQGKGSKHSDPCIHIKSGVLFLIHTKNF